MRTQRNIQPRRPRVLGIASLIALSVVLALPREVGFTIASVAGLICAAVLSFLSARRFRISKLSFSTGLALAVCWLVGYRVWGPGAEVEKLLAVAFYFVLIPSLVVSLSEDESWVLGVEYGIVAVWISLCGLGLMTLLTLGVSFDRAIAFGIHKNAAGMMLSLAATYMLAVFRLDIRLQGLVLVVTALALGGLTSKSSAVIIMLMWLLMRLRWRAVIFWCVWLLIPLAVWNLERFSIADQVNTAVQRQLLWRDALGYFLASGEGVFFGFGPGMFFSSVSNHGLAGMNSAHNYWLDFLLSYGAIPTLVVLIFLGIVVSRAISVDAPAGWAMAAFLLHAHVDVGFVRGPGNLAGVAIGLAMVSLLVVRKRCSSIPNGQRLSHEMRARGCEVQRGRMRTLGSPGAPWSGKK